MCEFIEKTESGHLDGGVAQLGEHLPCKQGVKGSIPFISTIFFDCDGDGAEEGIRMKRGCHPADAN